MRKLLYVTALALTATAAAPHEAFAWNNCKFSVGLNWQWQGANNNLLWGLWRCGPVGNEPCGPGGPYPGCSACAPGCCPQQVPYFQAPGFGPQGYGPQGYGPQGFCPQGYCPQAAMMVPPGGDPTPTQLPATSAAQTPAGVQPVGYQMPMYNPYYYPYYPMYYGGQAPSYWYRQ
jgi:hypothetical protein